MNSDSKKQPLFPCHDVEMGQSIVDETLVNCSVNDFKFSKSVDESLGTTEYWTPTDGPRQVWVNIEVQQLDKIDTVNQVFGSEFTVTQSWLWSKDDVKRNQDVVKSEEKEDQSESATMFTNLIKDVKATWEPKKLKFPNAVKLNLNIEEDELVLTRYNNLVLWEKKTHVSGIFAEKFELESFPFDCQDFQIQIAWQDLDSTCKVYPNPIQRTFVSLNLTTMVQMEYRIHEPIVESYLSPIKVVSRDLSLKDDYQCVIQINLKGQRYWKPYFWQFILLTAFMSTFSLSIFTLKLDDSGDRLSAIVTIFLAIVVSFAINNYLPRLSYSTFLDKYIRSCKLFAGSIIIQTSIISWLITHGNIEIGSEVDNFLLIGNTSILILGNIIFAIYCRRVIIPKERKKLIHLFESSPLMPKQTKQMLKENVIHKALKRCVTSGALRLAEKYEEDQEIRVCKIESWMAIQMQDERHFVYFGKTAMERIIQELYQLTPSNGNLPDYLRNYLTGMWYTKLVEDRIKILSAWMIINYIDSKVPQILFTKIRGDPNLPAGKVAMICNGIPLPGSSDSKPARVLIRKNKEDPDGYRWIDVNIQKPSVDTIKTSRTITDSKRKFSPSDQKIEVELIHY